MQQLLASRIKLIQPSATLRLTQLAKNLQQQGQDIISLAAGEPDFGTADIINQAAIEAINNNQVKYTNVSGIIELKKAIQEKFKKDNNLEYDLSEILVSNGTKQVIFNALLAILNAGDQVILLEPYWVSYKEMVNCLQGKNIIVTTSIDTDFKITGEQLEQTITTKTKCIILNSPCNPTGIVYSDQELVSIAKVLLKYPNILIICDDIYEKIIFDNKKFYTLAMIEPQLKNRILTVNGVSKAYAMTGWRIGYGAGPKWLIDAISTIQSHSTANACTVAQHAAIQALNQGEEFVQQAVNTFHKRRDLIYNMLSKITELIPVKPQGTFYIFVNCSKLFGKRTADTKIITNSDDVAQYFLQQAKVVVVPSNVFGIENYLRLSFTTSEEKIKQAVIRIKEAINLLL